ncbi:IclR family transcriptional regulator [Stakelama saccharophila]|uniref:IclR family transcriptional regulator n=1 Tax=Stakelama saccharophila TaxID=3075605 RepID=A0ABZ0B6C6_9SPHN|nr:IclR family transcriptional regulator [Stakelama sp. W311]WNO52845.1 IclR family transcriptional regulator [Stakelama sp. W311]
MTNETRYRAPALQKGLSILETLAHADAPMTMSDISTALQRSRNEIFRMLQVLEDMRYIARDDSGGYSLTNRLFALSMRQPPMRDLLSLAYPAMTALADEAGQSCHLAVASGAEMVVVARVEAPGLLGFAVRVGYRRPLHRSASGLTLLAFEPIARQEQMLDEIELLGGDIDRAALKRELADTAALGFVARDSTMIHGIRDISAPILAAGEARAALTIPYVSGAGAKTDADRTTTLVRAAAENISAALDGTRME